MRLYWEVARRALQRQLAYRTENLAGMVTNVFFGYLRAAVFVAVYQNANLTNVGGYDPQAAITYSWITQAMIMIVALWGWWDVEETIRTGDVVADLSKPFAYLVWPLVGQAIWAVVLLGCAQIASLVATRRVVIQGG